jgi:hypothetical protein
VLHVAALFLEFAYQFDRFGQTAFRLAPFILFWITLTSIAGLAVDRKLTFGNQTNGLLVSITVFAIAAVILFGMLTLFLPSTPVTQAAIRTYPAQAAYLKDMCYFIALGLFFLIMPFHFIIKMEYDIANGYSDAVLETLSESQSVKLNWRTLYPGFWALALLLAIFLVISLVMTTHLLDNLTSGPFSNLFTELVYVRGILYFGLGLGCLGWYYKALNRLKLTCMAMHDVSGQPVFEGGESPFRYRASRGEE